MIKLLSLMTIITLLFGLAIIDASAIPSRGGQAVIDEDSVDVLDHYPSKELTTADDYYKLGVRYFRRSMYQDASQQFEKALELDSKHVDSLIGLAASAFRLGDTEAAMEYSSEAIGIEPNSAKVRNAIGEIWMANANSSEHLDEAEARFKEAISLDPKSVPPHMNLAWLYMSKKKPDEAAKEYEAVIEIEPKNLAARRGLSTIYLNTGLLDKAVEEVEKIVELFPKDPAAHNGLGEMYTRKGQLDKALDEFQQAVKLEPKYAPGYKNIGSIHLLRGSPDKAIEEFESALSLAPNYGDAYAALGDAYLAKGMTQKAVEEYKNSITEKAIRTLPIRALISVYNNLAYIYAEEERDLDEALSFAQKARQVAPQHSGIADTLGWVYYKKGLYDEAVANLEAALEGTPDNPTIRYHLGAAYYRQGARDKAAAELKRALEADDKFEGAEDAKRLLTELETR
jgi:tetratricopeptide (TPR) repeat protein